MELLETERAHIPAYAHVPMVVAADGERLAKRAGSATIRALRERGIPREAVIGTLAAGLGLVAGPARPLAPREVAATLQPPTSWRTTPWPIPPAWS